MVADLGCIILIKMKHHHINNILLREQNIGSVAKIIQIYIYRLKREHRYSGCTITL